MSETEFVVVAPEVAEALAAGGAVVALETTLVTHGLPHPDGVEAAFDLEKEVRRGGAVPATIGVLDGKVKVGMANLELERLATCGDAAKLNPGNLAARLASGRPGSTTVGATIWMAERAGIRVMATGGIGGVHRGAAETGDVSADLQALARHAVAVVCAGAKAILDLPRTVEMLETLGVPVLGLKTDEFPAFYRRQSGLPVDFRYETIAEVAAAVRGHVALGGRGVLVTNPIPATAELPADVYEPALSRALYDAGRSVHGREVTPFLLERLRVLTGGRSVTANLALLLHNARVGAELAVALARRARE
jgi:pseudouridine-5'-phosphate glycosidase